MPNAPETPEDKTVAPEAPKGRTVACEILKDRWVEDELLDGIARQCKGDIVDLDAEEAMDLLEAGVVKRHKPGAKKDEEKAA